MPNSAKNRQMKQMIGNIIHECTQLEQHNFPLVLQAGLPLQSSANTRHLLDNIANLQPALSDIQRKLLAALKPDSHGR